jgi:hypothetical protein
MRAWVDTTMSRYNAYDPPQPRLFLATKDWMCYASIEETPVMTAANIDYAVKSFCKQTGLGKDLVMQFVDRALREYPASQGVIRGWQEKKRTRATEADRLRAAASKAKAQQTEQQREWADLQVLYGKTADEYGIADLDALEEFAAKRVAYEAKYAQPWNESPSTVRMPRDPTLVTRYKSGAWWPIHPSWIVTTVGTTGLAAYLISGLHEPSVLALFAALIGLPTMWESMDKAEEQEERRGAAPKDGP